MDEHWSERGNRIVVGAIGGAFFGGSLLGWIGVIAGGAFGAFVGFKAGRPERFDRQ